MVGDNCFFRLVSFPFSSLIPVTVDSKCNYGRKSIVQYKLHFIVPGFFATVWDHRHFSQILWRWFPSVRFLCICCTLTPSTYIMCNAKKEKISRNTHNTNSIKFAIQFGAVSANEPDQTRLPLIIKDHFGSSMAANYFPLALKRFSYSNFK